MDNKHKIAVLFHANLDDCKGQTNAILERVKNLMMILPNDMSLDVICTSYNYSRCLNILRGKKSKKKIIHRIIKDIPIQIEWRRFSIADYVFKIKLHREPFWFHAQIKNIINKLRDYDLVSAHSYLAGEIALELYKSYGVPYCVTWHGSDIHTIPFESDYSYSKTREIIENAEVNFFVSNALLEKSEAITKLGNKSLLYNGCSEDFVRYHEARRQELREEIAISPSNKIIAFVGNLIPVKNASLLPSIFHAIKNKMSNDVEFWIIGDGPQRESIMNDIAEFKISSSVKIFGNIPHAEMPQLMNCMDLLILPSKNEGLPLVTVEALKCGAKVIGSDVGGISEAIGKNNTVPLDTDFVNRFSEKCVIALNHDYKAIMNTDLDWHKTAQKELACYSNVLGVK